MSKDINKKVLELTEKVEKLTYERAHYKFFAEHDRMTGLYNHIAARERVEKLIDSDTDDRYALIVFDLDSFKDANDRYGHLFGDLVLKHIAKRIMTNEEEKRLAARIGGDEFMLIIRCGDNIEGEIARIFNEINCNYEDYKINASMGIALYPQDGRNYEMLFNRADKAMYAAKSHGKNKYLFYDDTMRGILAEGIKKHF